MNRRQAMSMGCAAAVFGVLVVPSGCSPQATTDYQGDALFSMTGHVEVGLTSSSDSPLIPSIAFMTPDQDVIRFADAEVHGEFPAQFQIDLYAPPPAESLGGFTWEELEGEPRHTIGYISAVTEEHLPMLYYASGLGGNEDHCAEEGCYQTFDAKDFDGTHSGTVTVLCPQNVEPPPADVPPDTSVCEVTARTGDPMFISFMRDPMFAGAVTNYALAYLESDAPANGVVAHVFGSPQGLSAGYHLVRWERPNASDEAAKQTCRDEAVQIAVDRYNQTHDDHVSAAERVVTGCTQPGCEMVGKHTRALRGEWYRVMAEMDCLPGPYFTAVENPGSEAISLQVAPGLSFTLAANGGF